LLELLDSKLKSSEQMKPRSRENLEEVENSMNFEGELWYTSKSWKVRDTYRHLARWQNLTTTQPFL